MTLLNKIIERIQLKIQQVAENSAFETTLAVVNVKFSIYYKHKQRCNLDLD